MQSNRMSGKKEQREAKITDLLVCRGWTPQSDEQ